MVPASHVKGTVTEIQRFQEDTGGAAYEIGTGKVYLNCGRSGADTSTNQVAELCRPDFFPDGVDEDCQPSADAKKKDVRYFDWATLHEVGHAVDDKNGIMASNQGKDEFGGWEVYGKSSKEAAKAAQKKFNFDLDYIKKRLKYNDALIQLSKKEPEPGDPPPPLPPDAPPAPKGREGEWPDLKRQVDKWCATVMGLRLWWEGEQCKEVEVGGRVYQLSYDTPEWVSYKLSARKQGIHGYQFRAPGEWFAELYAAYYLGMLKPEHPVIKEIKKLSPNPMEDPA
jgi:hypothetical protein